MHELTWFMLQHNTDLLIALSYFSVKITYQFYQLNLI